MQGASGASYRSNAVLGEELAVRIRSISGISLLVIAASLGIGAAVPQLRDSMDLAAALEHSGYDFLAEAKQRGGDPDAWLAALWCESPLTLSAKDEERAYERAAALLPNSAAPHVLYGGRVLRRVPLLRSEIDAYAGSGVPDYKPTEERPLSRLEREELEEAWGCLGRAAELAPQNAAIDYLMAYLALADRKDEVAMDLLRDALRKSGWDLYQREATTAAYKVARADLPPLEASVAAYAPTGSLFPLIHLARTVAGTAIVAEKRGDDARALFMHESLIHLGQLALRNGYTIGDGLMGYIIWRVASERELPEGESEDIESGARTRGGTVHSAEAGGDDWLAEAEAGRRELAGYLRDQGRDDLAEEVLAFGEAAAQASRRTTLETWFDRGRVNRWLGLTYGLEQSAHGMFAALCVVVVFSVVGFLLAVFRRPVAPVRWTRLGWVVLLGGCLATVCIVGLLLPYGQPLRSRVSPDDFLTYAGWTLPPWGEYFSVIGLPMILLVVLAVVGLHHRRHPEDRPVGPIGHYVGTVIAVFLPLAALFCLIHLSLAGAVAREAATRAVIAEAIMEQGELVYYGLGVQ